MISISHQNSRLQRRAQPLSIDVRLKQIAVVTSSPAISAGAARLFCALVAAADDEGRLMAKPRELAALVGDAAAPDRAAGLLRELRHHRILRYDATPRLATAVEIRLCGELLMIEADAMARRLRESRREQSPRQR